MTKKTQVWLPLLLSLAMIAGMLIGYNLKSNLPGKSFFSTEKRRPLQEVMELIEQKYVDTVSLNAITDTAIAAILNQLDPHSVFIPAEELQGVNDDIAGNFYGIGIEFNIIDDTLNVTNVLPGGPSEKAGIITGDKILQAGDSVFQPKTIDPDKVRKVLRGNLGSTIRLTILRNGKEKKVVEVNRDIIPVSSVDAEYLITPTIGYIRLNKFSQVTYREFMKALEGLKKKGMQQLILDLRNNGGGVLDEATAIADEFLDGDKLITYTEGSHYKKKEYRCKREGLFEKGKLVVLADEGTASASEILIGALQDWDRATIVGRRSFGKGLVQEQYDLSDGSALRLTVARYYTPIGRSIQRPYNNGEKAYYEEVNNRFHDGEALNADSIRNDTTKLFHTKSGKVVYGGGGITPDVFVALDTAGFSKTLSELYLNGTINDFAYHYYIEHQQMLTQYKSPQDFGKGFQVDEGTWQSFVQEARKDSVNIPSLSDSEKNALYQRIRSSIARQIWRSEGLYEILNSSDKTVLKALEILQQ